jgi:hypothetical protein
MMTTLQRLREPVTPLLAPSLDGASALGEVAEQRRLFDEAVERLRGLVARARRPGG